MPSPRWRLFIPDRKRQRCISLDMDGTMQGVDSGVAAQGPHRGGKDRAFTVLMGGSAISMFGSRISTIAFPMLVLSLSGSPLTAGLLLFAAIVPSMFIYVPAGAFVDRRNPVKVLLVSELGRGIVIALVVVWLLLGHPIVYFLIAAMIIEEVLEIFSTLADRRYATCLATQEDSSYAQACMEVRTHTAVLAGRPIGPFLFAISPIVPFLADAVSFLASTGSLCYIKLKNWTSVPNRSEPVPEQRLLADISDGFRWLHSDKFARVMMAMMACTTLIAQAMIMIFLAAAHTHQLSKVAIGVGLAASGVGGVGGSIVAGRVSGLAKGAWLQIQLAFWCLALGLVALSGGRSVPWIAFAMVVLGFTGAIGNVQFGTYIVRHVTDGRIARVTSIGQVLAIGASALGPVLGGWAIEQFGIHGAVVLLFMIVVPMALFSLFAPGPDGKPAMALLRSGEITTPHESPSGAAAPSPEDGIPDTVCPVPALASS
jgi:MFS transporter